MTTVNVHEAKTTLSKLLERVRRGETITIARAGKPCARLVPLEPLEARSPGLLLGKIDDAFFDELPEEELEVWE
jgi:prevent-host-death family protein